MNDKYIKEYEEMSLCDLADELVEPLFSIKQDLAKTIYIHYASERDKNEQLQQENQQLKKKYENAVADYEYEKSKNQRAIEYLGHCDCDQVCENITLYSKILLEILKGDKE